ncbi:membrane protein [Endozoicomonas montiporae]|uniref:Membrane protein n=2 Tax=Endozoicomonas montiporae TaxID=1027273 RepID=A0A081N2H7_9GAMM|nr:CDP-alcohol phosphatidyltransferase family protein [Endozoicomonas montiporae]AMO58382.1 phosphatidylglycerophosphate synthase [Endozoicomonas montiporae CL-33]KEQ12650.1 membrane protein [Endozoicomonas montiporae]
MLDRWSAALVRPTLHIIATRINTFGITPNQITVSGFFIGLLALPALATQSYILALLFICINRTMDGLDGALARIRGTTDVGGFLDIVLDFIFYASIIVGFALAAPSANALMACLLLCGFMATGSSFLAFAAIAAKQNIENPVYRNKSMYYLGGLAEGTETILFFIAMCLFPTYFPQIALVFTVLCAITATTRVFAGVYTFRQGNV